MHRLSWGHCIIKVGDLISAAWPGADGPVCAARDSWTVGLRRPLGLGVILDVGRTDDWPLPHIKLWYLLQHWGKLSRIHGACEHSCGHVGDLFVAERLLPEY